MNPSAIPRCILLFAGSLCLAGLLCPTTAAAQPYRLLEVANTGRGLFAGGQLFGTPVVNYYTGAVLFAGQDGVSRKSGIYAGNNENSAALVNTDPPGAPTQRVLDMNKRNLVLAVDGAGRLYRTSLASLNQARTFFPFYFDRGINAAIDGSDNVYYVAIPEGSDKAPSIFGVKGNAPPVRIADGRTQPGDVLFLPIWGFTGPKLADRGSQSFGPNLSYGSEFAALVVGLSALVSVNSPFTPAGVAIIDGVGMQPASPSEHVIPSEFVMQSDINASGQVVYRFYDRSGDIPVVHIKAAQTWNTPSNGSLPTQTLFDFPGAPPAPLEVTNGIAIAKDNTTYAVSLDNSISSSWVGAAAKQLVVKLGNFLNGRMITGIEVSERNFVANNGAIAFKARLADGTSSIVLAFPSLGIFPWRAMPMIRRGSGLQSSFDFPDLLPAIVAGAGTEIPLFVSLSDRRDTLSFTAPTGLSFTNFLVPQFTTEGHPAPQAHFTVHFDTPSVDAPPLDEDASRQSFEVEADVPFDFTAHVPGGVRTFFLDSFVDIPDTPFIIGLAFSADPSGQELTVINGASLVVGIEVKPGTATNPINLKSKGKIPVAILSMPDFNALSETDISSLTFGHSGDEESLAFCNPNGEDVNSDGLVDLVCHFSTQNTGFTSTDTFGILRGYTTEGERLGGEDAIRIVP